MILEPLQIAERRLVNNRVSSSTISFPLGGNGILLSGDSNDSVLVSSLPLLKSIQSLQQQEKLHQPTSEKCNM
jgi:hypothetical protein